MSGKSSNVFYVIVPAEAIKVTLIFTTLQFCFSSYKKKCLTRKRKYKIVPAQHWLIRRIFQCGFWNVIWKYRAYFFSSQTEINVILKLEIVTCPIPDMVCHLFVGWGEASIFIKIFLHIEVWSSFGSKRFKVWVNQLKWTCNTMIFNNLNFIWCLWLISLKS